MVSNDDRLRAAERAAREAGVLALEHFENLASLSIELKGVQDWVSTADREVESLLRSRLLATFPEDAFLGEEFGGREAEGVWVVDPIDGTGNYVRGIPLFGISIAYWCRGTVEVGVVFDPIHDELFAATRGGGATKNGQPIRVRDVQGMEDAVISIGFSTKEPKDRFLECVRGFLEAGAEFRRVGSAVLGLAWTAEGRVDAFWHTSLNAWDVLAGMLLVREAGGQTNAPFGSGELLRRAPSLATAPGIATVMSEICGVACDDSR